MNNFLKRTLTGTIFVAVLIIGILSHPFSLFILFFIITLAGLNEFFTIVKKDNNNLQKYLGICSGLMIYCSACLIASGYVNNSIFLTIIPFITCIFLIEIYQHKENPFQNIASTILGVIYIAVPFSLLVLAGFPIYNITSYHPHIILGLFILFWASDTGGYLVGITFGRHPLFPRISPKKSWEGFIGGQILTIIIAIILSYYIRELQFTHWIIIAIIVSIFGVWGDLTESMLKRSFNLKDSGNILPGHGGILDRFDAVIFAVPVVFIYLHTFVFR
jgi:phosphatidate cytidylyltransferase